MKTRTAFLLLRTALLLVLCPGVMASAAVFYTSGPLGTAIPDDTDTGLVRTLDVTESFAVSSLTVSLNLSVPAGQTGWAGDLYVYLQHDTGFSTLLNRVGRTADSAFGYGDGQTIAITLRDDATNGDFHSYRTVATGGESVALPGPLTGAWQPDGRTTDPALVVTGDPRNARLSQFNSLDSAGTWTLFLADLSGGNQYRLDSWGLQLEAVPEPSEHALIAGLALGTFACWRRRRSGEAQG